MLRSVHADYCHHAPVRTSELTPGPQHLTNSYRGNKKKMLKIKPEPQGSELCLGVCMLTRTVTMDL